MTPQGLTAPAAVRNGEDVYLGYRWYIEDLDPLFPNDDVTAF